MKKYKQWNITIVLILFFHFLTFAAPGDFGSETDPAPTVVPINTQLWILIVVALGYAFVKTRKELQKK